MLHEADDMPLRKFKVTRKGHVTISIAIREKLDIKIGDTILFEERDGHVAIVRPTDVVDRTAGIFKEYAKNGVEFDREQVWDEIVAERLQRMGNDE
jgi:AbrB family looped-hinge helix DNA binding protein